MLTELHPKAKSTPSRFFKRIIQTQAAKTKPQAILKPNHNPRSNPTTIPCKVIQAQANANIPFIQIYSTFSTLIIGSGSSELEWIVLGLLATYTLCT
jgi:hypothetical protein